MHHARLRCECAAKAKTRSLAERLSAGWLCTRRPSARPRRPSPRNRTACPQLIQPGLLTTGPSLTGCPDLHVCCCAFSRARRARADLGRRGWCGSDFAGFKQTASGLKYKDVLEGTGASPQAADTVRAHYCGYLLTGEIFDTSYRPALFPFRSVDACVRAAVLLGRVCFLR